jgi:hypothetical protein
MLSVTCDSESKGRSTIPQIPAQDSNVPRQRIEALGRRIAEHVRFMCALGTSGATSAEVREKALAAFYERLVVAERQLGQIRAGLQLE